MTIEELTALSDEELRVKVAEKMGWKRWGKCVRVAYPPGVSSGGYSYAQPLPPFSTSLDAIHEAWLTLDAHGQDVFAGYLSEIFMGQRDFGNSRINCTTKILGATARQRAIAFLLV